MKRKRYLLISLIIISIIAVFSANNEVFAAGAKLSASSTNIEPGSTINLSANVTDAASWSLDIQTTGGTLNKSSDRTGTTSDGENGNTTVNLGTFSAANEGSYTITLSGNVVDGKDLSIKSVSGSVTITVKAKEEPKPQEQDNNEQSGNNEQQGGNGQSGNNEQQGGNEQSGNNEQQGGNEQSGNNEQQGGNEQTGNNEQQGNNNQQEQTKPVEKVPTFTNTNETVYATEAVKIRKSYSTSSDILSVLEKGQSAVRTGIGDNGWSRIAYKNGVGGVAYIKSEYLTTTKPEEKKTEEKKPDEQKQEEPQKSSNTNLKELKVNVEGLTPAFDKAVKEYNLKVDAKVEKIEVTATTEDEKATYAVSGADELKTGDNSVLITVNAEDGTKTIYQIKVNKAAPEGLKLTKLEIGEHELSPKFNPDVFDYKLNVANTVDKLEIEAEASEEKATIEIVGNTELQVGENLVTIMAKSEDGSKTVTYQITVNKKEAVVVTPTKTSNNNGFDKIIIAVAVLIVIVILAIIAYLIKNKKHNSDLNSGNYYNGPYDDNDDNYDTVQNFEDDESYEDDYNNGEDDKDSGNGRGKHF